jgi:hypothetical protein
MKYTPYTGHQFSLFTFTPPRVKIKISTERIKLAMIECGKYGNTTANGLRELGEALEMIERKIK